MMRKQWRQAGGRDFGRKECREVNKPLPSNEAHIGRFLWCVRWVVL